ncbi:putative disease resistance protein RGA3 [Impatiens glandulifera]|uniref:putative disease resistance protein RGA3 n=1 Tax=Impatiens glandulifera TaxID=253017 RepID=UPI001FB0612A|nr:putative disease resistance protein RGA3 [Impatiens glandulifera]XP_047338557.1 putative disease resistance protein RGA3 [Impatiens glandulifera]XP_047338558.1 putative disease resistance protein RGA3 [Impatiens glandulifera]XP_047338559.1 putative disease resistance protein RGA3 [Impatiens glandulifera]XP_047338560.1 putative disease resistance protein RGA3 [Impatiens glandulifera]XP_047338561.1 putative disease resistance protein RGA3 [Impatiens glandulifera]XP_047338562.1 putative disea
MAEAALISGLLSNLSPLIQDQFSLFWSFKKEVQKLSGTLSSISAVLEDAERKKDKDKQTEDWLRKLKDVAYEVRDIMDECTYEDLRLQVNRRNASSSTRIKVTNSITHPFISTWTRLKVGHKIKDVQEKVNLISLERQTLHLRESIHDKFTSRWRETISLSSCNKVYGRDIEKKNIIDILVNNTSGACVDKKLSVLPIVGIGGLGKTTLAQTVFNDEEISKHFETKIWVCVSDEFDIQLVMRAILEEKAEARSEELQKKVREKLSGKRYLIVLDDVWNENLEAWDQLRSILDCGSNGAFVLTTTRKRNVAKIMETIQHIQISLLSDEDCWLLFEERAFMCGTPKTPNFVDIGKEIAKKCKGVPLVAKTFGGQLGFKNDINEWCKIRDNEIWKISQNEESDLLPILRLSYYELPYHLRRCFVFCAIFPKDAEIKKEILIQLWMAHGLIPKDNIQEVEDVGNTIWKHLCWRSFFQDEKSYRYGIYETCKMHDLMHDLAQSVMKDECYTMEANSSSDGLRREIRHVSAMVDEFVKTSVRSLKKIGGLQSLMLNGRDVYGNVTQQICLSVLKELLALRVLELSCNVQYQDLRYMGCLKHLRYLDISGNDEITTLPDSICDLLNLQTLKLNYCSNLESLPRNTKALISLRHLYLKGCDELKYMPRGMGKLKHLKTLSLFVISNKEKDCQLDELKELNIGGSLKLKNLGRVNDTSMKRGISMAKKTNINELELEWRSDYEDDEGKSTRDEKIGEALEVSTARLKILIMRGYKGVNPPKWVGNVNTIANNSVDNEMIVLFPLLENLSIWRMKNLRELVSPSCWSTRAFPNLCTLKISGCPKLGALPLHLKSLKNVGVIGECSDELLYSISNLNGTLTSLYLNELNNDVEHIFTVNNNMNGIEVVLFPLLEELVINGMKNLRELVSPSCWSTGAFPNLWRMTIAYCPKLGALPPHLKSLKDITVWGECSDELLYSISNLSALTHLRIENMKERSVLFGTDYMALLFEAQIVGGGVRSTFQSLQSLYIRECKKLRCLFDEGMISKISGCQNKHFINSLTELDISYCPELMISVEEFGNLNINNSLQRLRILYCPKLVSSEEADDVMALLHSLYTRLGHEKFRVFPLHKT